VSETRQQCPTCGERFADGLKFCPRDGAELVPATPPADTAARPASAAGRATWWRQIPRERLAGFLILAVIGLVVASVFAVRRVQVFRLTVLFQEGHGLKVGDSVFLRDVDVGEVTHADFEGDRFAAIVAVRPDAARLLRRDSLFYVGFEKLATQKKALKVLTLDPQSPPLASGSTVSGEDSPVRVYLEIAKRAGPQEAARFLSEFRGLLKDVPKLIPWDTASPSK
jgi:hypothetical protein